ncbi:MAG: hypothetical protein Q8L54_08565 [Devosia sp.]|nr:hypothetical protein [Devosia sp.]
MTNIAVVIPAKNPRAWQLLVAERLRAAGHAVSIEHAGPRDRGSMALDAILAIERWRSGQCLASVTAPAAVTPAAAAPDLVVDLTGSTSTRAVPVISILFEGSASMSSAARSLVSGRLPDLIVTLDGELVSTARPMVGERIWLSRGLGDVLARAITLIERTVRSFVSDTLDKRADLPAPRAGATLSASEAMGHALSLAPRLLERMTHKRLHREFHWQVGYRFHDGPGVAETGGLAGEPWTLLEEDGSRFFADPFPFAWETNHCLFVEDYLHARGKGVISVVEFDGGGRPGRPRMVLEEEHHLSYPQVFERDGVIWMLPESSGARRLVLYRADPFPDRWVADSVLLEGVEVSDATLLEHGGRLWLFAAVGDGFGNPSDTLHVHAADNLRGPWLPHAENPILIDRAAARPGGAFVHSQGETILPVQDGSASYGGGLGLARLLELSDRSVRMATPSPIAGAPAWPYRGIHTLNRSGRLEAIDGFDPNRKRQRR